MRDGDGGIYKPKETSKVDVSGTTVMREGGIPRTRDSLCLRNRFSLRERTSVHHEDQ